MKSHWKRACLLALTYLTVGPSVAPFPADPILQNAPSPSSAHSPAQASERAASPSPALYKIPSPTPTARPAEWIRIPEAGIENARIEIAKAERLLFLYDGESLVARLHVGLGRSPEGDKAKEGDGKTPTGAFYVCTRNEKSRYYLSLGLSYPNAEDAERGFSDGLISEAERDAIVEAIEAGRRPPWDTALGGEIMIHGRGGDRDWTLGCIALDDEKMDLLWEHCPLGTPVTIRE